MEIHDVVVLNFIHRLNTLCGKVLFEMFAPLECCVAIVGSLLPVFHDNMSVQPLRVTQS